jgi:HAD superfamily hydrolase (TIGR01509 family)
MDEFHTPPHGGAQNGASQPSALRKVPETAGLRALVTDIDGTLIATNALHTAAWCDAFRAHGYPVHPIVIAPMIGMGADKIVALVARGLSAKEGVGKAIAEDRQRRFLTGYLNGAAPTPGARNLFLALKGLGVKIYVATSAQSHERKALLERAGVGDLVEPPPPSPPRSKPDPDVVVAALEQAAVPPAHARMLGDTPYDISAASKAGIATIALRCGGWDDRTLASAALIYDDPSDALSHIDEWAVARGSESSAAR